MAPLPPLRDGGCALPICPFGRACHPLISDAPDCTCSPGRLWFWVVWASCPGAAAPISIHAPRVGRDRLLRITRVLLPISIHAPRVGRDCTASPTTITMRRFQSTRPVWGATFWLSKYWFPSLISIHAPRVGRDDDDLNGGYIVLVISIHAPRVGRDVDGRYLTRHLLKFQSTRPVWGATRADF